MPKIIATSESAGVEIAEKIFVETGSGLQTKSVTYTSNGDRTVSPDIGYSGMSSVAVTVNVPNPSTGKVNITSMNEVDVTNYATAQVVDADLVASNIKKDINILGITGTYEPSEITVTPISITANGIYNAPTNTAYSPVTVDVPNPATGNVIIRTLNQVDVKDYATAQVVDSDLIASNIKKDVDILGVVGTYEGGVTPTGTINITANGTYDVTNYATAQVSLATYNGEVQ